MRIFLLSILSIIIMIPSYAQKDSLKKGRVWRNDNTEKKKKPIVVDDPELITFDNNFKIIPSKYINNQNYETGVPEKFLRYKLERWIDSKKNPIEQLIDLYTNDTAFLLIGGINFKSFDKWFFEDIHKQFKQNHETKLPFVWVVNTQEGQKYNAIRDLVALMDTTINNENYKVLTSKLIAKGNSLNSLEDRVWCSLHAYKLFVNYEYQNTPDSIDRNARFWHVMDSLAGKILNYTKDNISNKVRAKIYESIGDFYQYAQDPSSAVYYYSKAKNELVYFENKLGLRTITYPIERMRLANKVAEIFDRFNLSSFADVRIFPQFQELKDTYADDETYELGSEFYLRMIKYFHSPPEMLLQKKGIVLDTFYMGLIERLSEISREKNFSSKATELRNWNLFLYELIGEQNHIVKQRALLNALFYSLVNGDLKNNRWKLNNILFQLYYSPVSSITVGEYREVLNKLTGNTYDKYFQRSDEVRNMISNKKFDSARILLQRLTPDRIIAQKYGPNGEIGLLNLYNQMEYLFYAQSKANIDSLITYSDFVQSNIFYDQNFRYEIVVKELEATKEGAETTAIKLEKLYLQLELEKAKSDKLRASANKAKSEALVQKKIAEMNTNAALLAEKDARYAEELAKAATRESDSLKNVAFGLQQQAKEDAAAEKILKEKAISEKAKAEKAEKKSRNLFVITVCLGLFSLLLTIASLVNKAKKTNIQKVKLEAQAALSELNPHFIRGSARRLPKFYDSISEKEKIELISCYSLMVENAYNISQKDTTDKLEKEKALINNLCKFYNLTEHKENPVSLSFYEDEVTVNFFKLSKMPSMLIFNAVENALTKGFLEYQTSEKRIKIYAQIEGGKINLCISDNGKGFNVNSVDKRGLERDKKIMAYYNLTATKGNKIERKIISKEGEGTIIIYQFS